MMQSSWVSTRYYCSGAGCFSQTDPASPSIFDRCCSFNAAVGGGQGWQHRTDSTLGLFMGCNAFLGLLPRLTAAAVCEHASVCQVQLARLHSTCTLLMPSVLS
jgi:hypothetical protein